MAETPTPPSERTIGAGERSRVSVRASMKRLTPVLLALLALALVAPPATAGSGTCDTTSGTALYVTEPSYYGENSPRDDFLKSYAVANPCQENIAFGVTFTNGRTWTVVVLAGAPAVTLTPANLRSVGLATQPRVASSFGSGWGWPCGADAVLGTDGVLRPDFAC
jgi:hypothetical protein